MSDHQHHIIHSLKYEVHFDDKHPGDRQNALSSIHHDEAQKLLQHVFDAVSTADTYLQINTLELDLGIILPENWKNSFINLLGQHLDQKLSIKISEHASSSTVNEGADKMRKTNDISVLSKEESEEDAFLFFLQNGYLKWTVSRDAPVSVNNIFEKILIYKSKDFVRRLITLLLHSEVSRKRFLVQIHPDLKRQWIKSILPAQDELSKEIFALPQKLKRYLEISDSLINKICFWLEEKLILHALQQDVKDYSSEDFINRYSENLLSNFKDELIKAGNFHIHYPYENPKSKIVKLLIPLLDKTAKTTEKTKDPDPGTKQKTISKDSKESVKVLQNDGMTNGMPVENAGLIILWPYLSALFSEFQLLSEGRFKGVEEANQALFMLHYLATGTRIAEEHVLMIPKILISYDMDMVVPLQLFLEDSVYTECDQLIKTSIRHWTALRSTSPGGLRQTFLQRQALATLKEDGWHLMFERKGVDVLLDNLPYGISLIKLKWMENPIYVTW